jgi:predicted RNA binding protein YcfA (HicA-like mRNA interferase family)
MKRALKNLGFEYRNTEGSHEQWVGTKPDGSFAKVTVDCPKAPFSQGLTKMMANQAGRTVAQIYAALD